jgi:hypothetical protein
LLTSKCIKIGGFALSDIPFLPLDFAPHSMAATPQALSAGEA